MMLCTITAGKCLSCYGKFLGFMILVRHRSALVIGGVASLSSTRIISAVFHMQPFMWISPRKAAEFNFMLFVFCFVKIYCRFIWGCCDFVGFSMGLPQPFWGSCSSISLPKVLYGFSCSCLDFL